MSDSVQVSVKWGNNTVFAGESVECTITFTNPSQSNIRRSPSPQLRAGRSHRDRWKDSLPAHVIQSPARHVHHKSASAASAAASIHSYPRSHKPALSSNEFNGGQTHWSVTGNGPSAPREPKPEEKSHRRSVSIVSIGSETIEESPARGVPLRPRPAQFHGRAASLQILPRRSGLPSPNPSGGDQHSFILLNIC